jgi:hypothetical protein
MQSQVQVPTKEVKNTLPLLSLITFSPIGNPLSNLTDRQRSLFFEYLLFSLHNQRKEQLERTCALAKKAVLPAALSGSALHLSDGLSRVEKLHLMQKKAEEGIKRIMQEDLVRQKLEQISLSIAIGDEKLRQEEAGRIALGSAASEEEGKGASGKASSSAGVAGSASGIKFIRLVKTQQGKKGTEAMQVSHLSEGHFSSSFGQHAKTVSGAIGQMAPVIDDYARGSEAKEKRVVGEFHESMRSSDYKTDDIMASLLMVIEDDAWSGEEAGFGGSKPHAAIRLSSQVPLKLRSSARESAEVRLASVREMLRYFFLKHPDQYSTALAAALGITTDQGGDAEFLQERLAYALASIGSFALAQKILYELKKEMDTKICLLMLGYRYDAKNKRLVLGKRTCGRPAEARRIIGMLLAAAKKR